MYAHVARFTEVTPERISEIVARLEEREEEEGLPPSIDSTGIELLFDEAQGTAIFVAHFQTEQKMRDASAVFEEFDPSETPGTRASVDLCEVEVERPYE